jgi:hypothetical protein
MAERVVSYRRPLSTGELRQIRRKKWREFVWCAVAVIIVLGVVVSLLCAIYQQGKH